ncbi:CLUMA_CG012539, isoform A [Clunio marinus]|uniref:CLUMA_CG012539, isoform A n=1 Tax=Clunio marinus TaxID=568069 RepID=A0A1J1IJG7_9DIPT|nr:CLUMA_CG012539, isoform A [Clunio marinus]
MYVLVSVTCEPAGDFFWNETSDVNCRLEQTWSKRVEFRVELIKISFSNDIKLFQFHSLLISNNNSEINTISEYDEDD